MPDQQTPDSLRQVREILITVFNETHALPPRASHRPIQEKAEVALMALIEAAPQELERLRARVFRPGVMRCAKCSFRLIRNVLHLQSGNISAGDSQTEPCPNGCGPLWPVTWEDECKAADVLWSQQVERAVLAEAARDEAQEISRTFADHWPYGVSEAGDKLLADALCAVQPASARAAGSPPAAPPSTLPLRPMSEAPKDKTPISARITSDVSVLPERHKYIAGLWFTVRHGGMHRGEYDMGWQYPGHGGIPDHWFEGWWPLPSGDLDPFAQSAPA